MKRLTREILNVLEDLPRQHAALETAMATFGEDFDLREFKAAYEVTDPADLADYNRVQAVERGLGRVQNYVAELAIKGVRLAELPTGKADSEAHKAFDALRDDGVISASLCRRLIRAQKARSRIEHGYLKVPAGDVHRAAQLVSESAREFVAGYGTWIRPLLESDEPT